MFRLSQMGYVSLMGSIVMLIFQGIASVLNEEFDLKDVRMIDFVSAELHGWIEGIHLFSLNSLIDYLLNLQLFAFLFVMSIMFFVLSGIFERSRI